MIKVLFFAALREQLNCETISIQLENNLSIEQVIKTLVAQHPEWQSAFDNTLLCAVNQTMVAKSHLVKSGDEVAFFPPVTGG